MNAYEEKLNNVVFVEAASINEDPMADWVSLSNLFLCIVTLGVMAAL